MNRMSAEVSLNLYITAVHPCPYLPERQAMNLLVDPSYKMTPALYGRLLNSGFRRSGDDVYRPHCRHCSACISCRIPVNAFKADRSQRRNWKRNQDLRVVVNRHGFKPEYTDLYRHYIKQRHADGGMDKDDMDTFAGFLLTRWCNTLLVEFWEQERLLAVAAVDELNDGLSSVYTFFDPCASESRGLGTFAVLWQIEQARQSSLQFVYPGYWIAESPKMRYKINFQPMEGLVNGVWTPLAAGDA